MAFTWELRLVAVSAVLAGGLAGCHSTVAGPPSAASVPAGKGILFDPGSAPLPGPPKVGPLPPLAVLDSGPRGRTDIAADIHVRFNQPVVSLGEQSLQAGGVQLVVEPMPKGRSLWHTPDLLVFEPDKLAPAQRYTVSLRALPGQGGPAAALAETQALTWTFETPGPEVETSHPSSDEEPENWGIRQAVFVKLSQPVSIGNLRAQVRVWATSTATKTRKAIPARIAAASSAEVNRVERADWLLSDAGQVIEAGRLFKIRPVDPWPSASKIAVEVPAGLVGRLGPVGSASDWKLAFPTPGPLAIKELRCWNLGAWDGRDEENEEHEEHEDQDRVVECSGGAIEREITLTLTSRVAKSQLKHVQIAPRPRGLALDLVGDYDDEDTERLRGGFRLTIRGRFAAGKTYRIRLAPQMRSTNGYTVGDGTGGRALSRLVSIEEPVDMDLSGGGIFPASAVPVVGVQTRRVKSLQVRVASLDQAQAARLVLAEKGFRMGRLGKDDKPLADWGLAPSAIVSKQLVLSPKGPTAWSDLALDLRDLVGAARGAVVVEVAADSLVTAQTGIQPRLPQPMRSLFWITDLAPIVFQSPTRIVVKMVRLSDTQPLAGARIARYDEGAASLLPLGQTDSSGLLVLERNGDDADAKLEGSPLLVVDPAGADYTVVRLSGRQPIVRGDKKTAGLRENEALLLGMVTERDAYRPGEVVYVVAWAAIDTPYAQNGLRALPAGTSAEFSMFDHLNKQVAQQSAQLDANGKFWAKLRIPDGTPLGSLKLEAQVMGSKKSEYLKLEDFRTPEFEVGARPLRSSILAGETTPISVQATHYSGVPVTIDELAYVSRCHSFRYQVPNLEEGFVVGQRETWDSKILPRSLAQDAAGQHGSATFTPVLPQLKSGARRCSVDVQVQDASRQVVGAQADLVVHPASYYVALRAPSSVYAGDSVTIPVRAVDPDGRRVAGKSIKVEVTRHFHQEVESQDGGRTRTHWEERKEIAASCALNASTEMDRVCVLSKVKQGTYTIVASGTDGARTARTRTDFWVWPRPVPVAAKPTAKVEPPAHLSIEIQNADSADSSGSARLDGVKLGDRLHAIVRSPCDPSRGFLLVEKAGIRQQHVIAFKQHEATLDLVTDDSWTPQVFLEANVVCPAAKQGAYPTLESAEAMVWQRATHRELKVEVTAPAHSRPAETIPIAVSVNDARGEPLGGSRVALWAVDEAVLSLTGYRAPNPLTWFVPNRWGETTTLHPFSSLLHPHVPSAEDPWLGEAYGVGGLGMGGGGIGAGGVGILHGGVAAPLPARARFETTPIFLADLAVGPDGQVKTTAKLPDNLTTFRITAVASALLEDGKSPGRFGLGEGSVQVTTPFIVRPALPRSLRPNDETEIAAIVQNQTEWNGRLLVEASIGGGDVAPALELIGPGKVETQIPANGQMRIPFTVRALRAGVPEVELRGRLFPVPAAGSEIDKRESYTDAVRLPIPVEPESTLVERAALYGSLDSDEPVAIETRLPAARSPTVGGISVTASASLLGELQDAFTYLVGYPYGCIEQTSSQVLSLIAAQQLGKRYALPLEEPSKRLAAGIERIASMQTSSGGFSYWPEGKEVHPYATAFATWTLLLARQSGVAVPQKVVGRALDYLEASVREAGPRPHRMASFWYGDPNLLFQSERAIALHVLAEAGRGLPAEALAAAYAERSQLSQFGRSQVLMALHRSVGDNDERSRTMTDELLAGISELPATAHVREVNWYGSEQVFHSEARSDAMALLALLQTRPEHAVIPKLVRGLLERRLAGKWRNTQENVHAVLAVLEYARRFEAEKPHFSAQAWAGGKSILNTAFGLEAPLVAAGAPSGFLPTIDIPALGKPPMVVIQRRGQGRLYYRLGTEWLPSGESLPASNQGIEVERVVRAREAGREVAVDSGPVASGESVVFDITVKNRTQLSYVVVNVPVPAGLEPVQENLGKGHSASAMAGEGGYWISYQEKRRDRVLLFADVLAPGRHSHTIQLRATTPGRYALPPARAEAMYTPEVYGRSEGGHLVVK
jgi:Large extracellular alpha-helical protein